MSVIVKAVRVDDEPSAAGEFRIVEAAGEICGMRFKCPCGCGVDSWVPFKPSYAQGWTWNGDRDRPTLTPSIQQLGTCRWHGFLTDGEFRPC